MFNVFPLAHQEYGDCQHHGRARHHEAGQGHGGLNQVIVLAAF